MYICRYVSTARRRRRLNAIVRCRSLTPAEGPGMNQLAGYGVYLMHRTFYRTVLYQCE